MHYTKIIAYTFVVLSVAGALGSTKVFATEQAAPSAKEWKPIEVESLFGRAKSIDILNSGPDFIFMDEKQIAAELAQYPDSKDVANLFYGALDAFINNQQDTRLEEALMSAAYELDLEGARVEIEKIMKEGERIKATKERNQYMLPQFKMFVQYWNNVLAKLGNQNPQNLKNVSNDKRISTMAEIQILVDKVNRVIAKIEAKAAAAPAPQPTPAAPPMVGEVPVQAIQLSPDDMAMRAKADMDILGWSKIDQKHTEQPAIDKAKSLLLSADLTLRQIAINYFTELHDLANLRKKAIEGGSSKEFDKLQGVPTMKYWDARTEVMKLY